MSRAAPSRVTAVPPGKTEGTGTLSPQDADAHFSGKRLAERHLTDLPVELRGGSTTLSGRAVDLSEGGVRVRLLLEGLREIRDSADAMGFLRVVERHFARGLEVSFQGTELVLPAAVVRLVAQPKAGGDLFLACRFTANLTPEQMGLLVPAPGPTVPDAPLPFEARQEGKLRLFVDDAKEGPEGGTSFAMRVEGAGPDAVDAVPASAQPLTVREALARLGDADRPARLVHGKSAVWKGRLRLVSASPVQGETPTVRVRFRLLDPIGDVLSSVMKARD